MASKRQLRKKRCIGKVKYENRQSADSNLARQLRQHIFSGHVSVYHCQFCGKYHIGHTPTRIIKNIPSQNIFVK